MTGMRRITICIPEDLNEALRTLRKTDRYCEKSLGEIIRAMIAAGLEAAEQNPEGIPAGSKER